jgi:hypothetical protein
VRGQARAFALRRTLPDTAGVGRHHGLAGFAAEGLAELGHVLHDSVDSELPGRMGIGLHLQAELFRAGAAAPALPVTQEELLQGRVAVLLRGEVDALTLGIGEKGNVGEPQTAVVGGILAQVSLPFTFTSSTATKLPYSLTSQSAFSSNFFASSGSTSPRDCHWRRTGGPRRQSRGSAHDPQCRPMWP